MEFSSITETLKIIKSKQISIEELNKIFIKRIKDKSNINAFIYFNEENIIERSRKIDKLGNHLSLKGIPLAIKDLFCTKHMPTTGFCSDIAIRKRCIFRIHCVSSSTLKWLPVTT